MTRLLLFDFQSASVYHHRDILVAVFSQIIIDTCQSYLSVGKLKTYLRYAIPCINSWAYSLLSALLLSLLKKLQV